jgi:hypothetical protein
MDRDRALIQYWRNSLADVDLRSPEIRESNVFQPGLEEILAGRLAESLTREIFRAAETDRRRRRGKPGEPREPNEELIRAPLLLAPFGIRRLFRHGAAVEREARRYNPVWIPAFLTRDGALERGEPGTPWISRELLEPVARDQPVVGRLDDFDRFLTEEPQPSGPRWAAVIAHVTAMTKAVVGETIESMKLSGFEILPPLAILRDEDRGMGRAILDLYDKTLKRETIPALLRTLALGTHPAPAPDPYDLTDSGPALRHLGQMGRLALSPSQRQTVQGLAALGNGAVLAVNGPPGTGKTTVLQSVVASLWVEAALTEKGVPPIILACSTNNQAVTNILKSFGEAASPEAGDPWTERWLPGLTSYGLYFPAYGKRNDPELKDFQIAAPGRPVWTGLPERMERPEFVREAEAEYLARARAALEDPGLQRLETVAQRLQGSLAEARKEVIESIAAAREVEALRRRHGCSTHAEAVARSRRERDEANAARLEQESLHAEVLAALQAVPFWEDLLAFLPSIRERRDRRLLLPFRRRRQRPPDVGGASLARVLPERLDQTLSEIRERLDAVEAWERLEVRWAARLGESGGAALDEPARVLDVLDRQRHRLFLLAGRYWEARWLMEIKALLASGRNPNAQSRAACEARFRRFAMLTPCMVATFHQAPKVFDHWDRDTESSLPLFETLDLLIVDEAGQVSPEVGAATFALAKRAVVVGDLHQIEPVWGIPPSVDRANLKEVGIEPPRDEEGEDGWAFRASRGSVMALARRATAITCMDDRGLFLSEHRRCVPEVIRFCNELVYQGRLHPLRPSQADRILPPLGWAHIASPASADGGSRSNAGEARAIAAWLARHRSELEGRYGEPLARIVAVITPFAAQRLRLERALRDAGIAVPAGTVHTFQGAERPVVLFSPVYSFADAPHSLFFDAGPNLLNVAVSRAKDSFLLFGDMRIFDPFKSSLPSGRLARLVFAAEDGEITDVEAAQHLRERPEVERISKLEDHRRVLREALATSRERVLIVSPYLSRNAVAADDIPGAIAAASERGVRVCVVYSRDFHRRPDWAAQVAETLSRAGAEVKVATRMHSKTLAVDGNWIVEGSFNWLSAQREGGHRYQYQEASLLDRSSSAPEFIRNAWRDAAGEEMPVPPAAVP